MLRLSSEQYDWVLTQQRERLALALAAVLQQQWPALAAKLGDRCATFVDAALQQAHRYGLVEPAHAARYVNLWCVWGPAFDDKPGFEWAAEILRDDRRSAPVKAQQLALQSRDVLVQRAAPGLGPQEFDAADAAMEAVPGSAAAAAWIEGTGSAQAQPRQVCDLSAFDLALGDQSWRTEYRLAWSAQGTLINHAPLTAPPQRYRTDVPTPPGVPVLPRQVAALAYPAARGHKAWLHLRCAIDSVCDERRHPRVEIKSAAGGQVFEGMAARQIKLPLHCAEPFVPPRAPTDGPTPVAGPGKPGAPVNTLVPQGALCREVVPRYLQIGAQTCGLRRFGAPLGPQEATVSVFPAEQWLLELKTSPQPAWHWPEASTRTGVPPAVVRLERDAQPLSAAPWQAGWAQLNDALINGMDGWYNELTRSEVLLQPRLDLTPNLMHGTSAWTWGAREVCHAEGSEGFLRVQAIVRLMACALSLDVAAELRHHGAHARVRLHAQGEAPMHADLLRESPEEDLAAQLATLKTAWRFPFQVEVESVSSPALAVMRDVPGGKPGAVVGEAGLRPRQDGAGWAWFCTLKLEPAVLALTIADPQTGLTTIQRELWPAITLLDWSAG
jgi:hypothetical protein